LTMVSAEGADQGLATENWTQGLRHMKYLTKGLNIWLKLLEILATKWISDAVFGKLGLRS